MEEMNNRTTSNANKPTENALIILKTIKMYSEQAVNYNILKPSTGVRLAAAIDYLMVAYTTVEDYENANSKFFPYNNNLTISLSDLFRIKEMAKPVEEFENDITIKDGIDVVRAMLTKFIKYALDREQKEVLEEDIDKLLNAISKVDELIDNAQ